MTLVDRVVARHLEAKTLTKEWLLAVRRGWLSLLTPTVTSWDDAQKAANKLVTFARNLEEQVKYVRRVNLLLRPDAKKRGQLIQKTFDRLHEALEEAAYRVKSWRLKDENPEGYVPHWHLMDEEQQDEERGFIQRAFKAYQTEFANTLSAGVAIGSRSGSLTELLDKVLKLLREDANMLADYRERNPEHPEEDEIYNEFSIGRVKVIVDPHVPPAKVKIVIEALKEARDLITRKGFGKAWYGNVVVVPDGTLTQDQIAGYAAQGYNIQSFSGLFYVSGDSISIVQRAGPNSIISTVVHETGHRWWYKFLRSKDRARFVEWVKSGLAPVSEYGGTNPGEAFAEAFLHYVREKRMTRDQIETFKETAFQKLSHEERVVQLALQTATTTVADIERAMAEAAEMAAQVRL